MKTVRLELTGKKVQMHIFARLHMYVHLTLFVSAHMCVHLHAVRVCVCRQGPLRRIMLTRGAAGPPDVPIPTRLVTSGPLLLSLQ